MRITAVVAFCFVVNTLWSTEASPEDVLLALDRDGQQLPHASESLIQEEENEVLARRKRQAPAGNIPFSDGKGLLIYFREVVLTIQDRQDRNAINFTTATATTEYPTGDFAILTLQFPPSTKAITTEQFDLKMTFEKGKMGYYKMNNATVTLKGKDSKAFDFPDVKLSSAVDLTVPEDKSFHCSRFGSLYPREDPDKNHTHTFSIDIKGFQIQAFMPADTAKEVRFVDAYECVGFFTPGIWMGIIVTLILISILTWGMKMIMDIKTMDRFDDPKGKPISFGSGE